MLGQHTAHPPPDPAAAQLDAHSQLASLDPSAAAKQMAALSAAGIARRASSSGGTSGGYVGGISLSQYNARPPIHDVNPPHAQPLNTFPTPSNVAQAMNGSMQPPQDPFAAQRAHAQSLNPAYRQRLQAFLAGLAQVHTGRGMPLPMSITGVPSTYDPSRSPWKALEPTSDLGGFKLAGRDVSLFKLWGLVVQLGGSAKVHANNAWPSLLPAFALPERLPVAQGTGNSSTAQALATYFQAILVPFEEAYSNTAEAQRRQAMAARGQLPGGGMQQLGLNRPQAGPGALSMPGHLGLPASAGPGQLTGNNGVTAPQSFPSYMSTDVASQNSIVAPQTPQRPGTGSGIGLIGMTPPAQGQSITQAIASMNGDLSQQNISSMNTDTSVPSFMPSNAESDGDSEGRKRKSDELDGNDEKRTRRKMDLEPPVTPNRGSSTEATSQAPTTSTATSTMPSSSRTRRKIEYVPFAREVDTAGGRDVRVLEAELARVKDGRPLRDIDEWGAVEIDLLAMSIRSRITSELSYALTTLTILSAMTGNGPNTGFPIHQCADLMDDLLDLLQEYAFGEDEDFDAATPSEDARIITHRDLANYIQDDHLAPFAALKKRQGSVNPELGPGQRRGDVIRALITIFRNLSTISENQAYIAQHPVFLDLVLRLATLCSDDGRFHAASPALSLSDLVWVRREVLNILASLAPYVHLSSSPSTGGQDERKARKAYELIASYLVDPTECLPPASVLMQSSSTRPSYLPDLALDVFTRLAHPDGNRQCVAHAVPRSWMWTLFEALVHRLPISDADFHQCTREVWLCFVEKIGMALYALAFLLPPDMKRRVKTDRSLGFVKVMLRLVRKFLVQAPAEYRPWFMNSARRAIETLKLIDDGDDAFDTSQSTVPLLSFGMGYGEGGDQRTEKGTGILGGHLDEVIWGVMLQRDLDLMTFGELDSMVRVEVAA